MQMFLRSMLITAVTVSLIAVAAPGAGAHHRPNLYCSESGDLCQSTRKVDGVRKLSLLMAEEYFEHYRLCVFGPTGERSCKRFAVGDAGGDYYGHELSWRRHFPHQGPGAYTVVWRAMGERVGRKLGFHVRR